MKQRIKPMLRCPRCNHIELEEITLKKRIWKTSKYTFKAIFIAIILISAAIGFLATYNFIIGINYGGDTQLDIGDMFATLENNLFNKFQSTGQFKEFTLNLTKKCETNECKVEEVYKYLSTFEFISGTESDTKKIFEEKECDCDECSRLMIAMLDSINIKSFMDCNLKKDKGHCWTFIKLNNGKKFKVDIVQSKFLEIK